MAVPVKFEEGEYQGEEFIWMALRNLMRRKQVDSHRVTADVGHHQLAKDLSVRHLIPIGMITFYLFLKDFIVFLSNSNCISLLLLDCLLDWFCLIQVSFGYFMSIMDLFYLYSLKRKWF